MKLIICLFMLFSIVACSGSKSKAPSDEGGIELTDSNEFLEEPTEDIVTDSTNEIEIDETNVSEYVVQSNETLMMISFKIYGDYGKWRSIQALNSDQLNSSSSVKEGMVLKYNAPVEQFSWNPDGSSYLVKTGDTLGSISTDTYGEKRFWKEIWNNNKPLIKDPNLIFAGFTIYTPEIENRDVASEDL